MPEKGILWDEKLSVGIRQFDDHHKKIIGMIHELSVAQEKGEKVALLSDMISDLSGYVRYHFTAEERVMETYNYDEIREHINEHRFFAGKIESFQDAYARGQKNVDEMILSFLRDWFVSHIMVVDRKYGIFLNSHGMT